MRRLIKIYLILLQLAKVQLNDNIPSFSLENCPKNTLSHLMLAHQPIIRVLASSLAPIMTVTWNSTGHVANLSGLAPYILDLVAQRIGLPYCWVPLGNEIPFDDTPALKGLVNRLSEGKGDLLVGTLIRTAERFKLIDFTMPILEGPYSIMIPYLKKVINTNALKQPFQNEVWIYLLIAVVFVINTMHFLNMASKRIKRNSPTETNFKNNIKINIYDTFTYVFTILLTQGNHYSNQKTTSRLIAGAWCLGALILISAYSGTLLSFIMSPVGKHIINSIYDIPNVPGLRVALDRGRAADTRLGNDYDPSTKFGKVVREIQKKIVRCNTSAECIDKVLFGSHVYIHGKLAMDKIILDDLAHVGTCRFTEAKETFWNGFLCWGIPKKAPLYDDFNKAILELDAFGLSTFWKTKILKVANACMKPEDPSMGRKLSFSHLSVPFMLLGIGYAFGLLCFITEKAYNNLLRY